MTSSLSTTELCDRFAKIYTGAIADVLDERGHRQQSLPAALRPLQPDVRFAGRALPCAGVPATSDDPEVVYVPLLEMLGAITSDDVVVMQGNVEEVATFGELCSTSAKSRGARGAVIDGGVRDVEYILDLGFPVVARYATPADVLGRWRLTDHGEPVVIGGVQVRRGDVVVADRTGVVVVPAADAEDVLVQAEAVMATENQVRDAIVAGQLPLEAYRRFGRF